MLGICERKKPGRPMVKKLIMVSCEGWIGKLKAKAIEKIATRRVKMFLTRKSDPARSRLLTT